MSPAPGFPSLIDDAEFLAELEKLEGAAASRGVDRASHEALATGFDTASKPTVSASTRPGPAHYAGVAPLETVLRRDVDRWQLTSDGEMAAQDEMDAGPRPSLMPTFLTILIGLSAGAAVSVAAFHDRIAWLLDLWSR